jgi:hypothetical protein
MLELLDTNNSINVEKQMNDQTAVPPMWFWVVGVLALLWNALGMMAFVAEMNQTPESLAALTEAQRNLYEIRPGWATAAFAIAVIAGLLGSVLLLMKRSWASLMFTTSVLGLVVQNYYSFVVANVHEVFGQNVIILPAAVFLVAILLLWFSRSATEKGWLN